MINKTKCKNSSMFKIGTAKEDQFCLLFCFTFMLSDQGVRESPDNIIIPNNSQKEFIFTFLTEWTGEV